MKYKTTEFELEGEPSEIRNFLNTKQATKKYTMVDVPMSVQKRKYTRRRFHGRKIWKKSEDQFLTVNWQTCAGRGDRTKYKHNKKVAKELNRSVDACRVRYKKL